MYTFTEANYENAIIELFNGFGYRHIYGPSVERDFHCPLHEKLLVDSLFVLNPALPQVAIDEVIYKLKNLEGTLVQKNTLFTNYFQNGVPIKYIENAEEISSIVYLVDFNELDKNSFVIANQWTVVENANKRPDIILFINGLPLVVMELKSPSREDADTSSAYRQLRNYMHDIPSLFTYNMICVMSDQAISKAGTITAKEDRFMEWKTIDGDYENTEFADFNTFFEGLFDKKRLLDILQNFVCFSSDSKILSGYHQYFAVNKAILSTKRATESDGKGGVFWHTQGSGKSLSMVFYAHLLQDIIDAPTIVVITDRNDLDNQLFTQFSKCSNFLRQVPIQAISRTHLKELLDNRQANGIIFTTMQKFEESDEALSERRNIIVMADEAHRGQYGLSEKVDSETGKIKIGIARIIRNSLPNATYIGFTGTPISSKDRSTLEVFGDYIDIYDMTQSVEDGATRPVYYESRVIKLNLDSNTMKIIDDEYENFASQCEEYVIEKSKRELSKMEAILGAEQTINSLVDDILSHYEDNRRYELTGKAMIVAYSRPIAMKIYERILELRPYYSEVVKIVMTSSNNDNENWRKIIGNKKNRENLATQFKDNNSSFKIAIVVDMWLTGFDVPSLATMYIYKPMSGHNLMQAIARVNRVFLNKECGLVVDYVGIASALKQAMNDYTSRDKKRFGDNDITTRAYPEFLKILSVCQDFFHGLEYSLFITGTDLDRANLIRSGVNFIIAKKHTENNLNDNQKSDYIFVKQATMLKQSLSLCSSIVPKELRVEAAYFEAVKNVLSKLLVTNINERISLPELNEKINNLLKSSIRSDGVINLFSDIKKEFSLFDPEFLNELAKMKEKNLAIELLKKLINEQVYIYRKTNVVKSEQFSKLIQEKLNLYLNGMLSNEEIIAELLKMANEMAGEDKKGKEFGLSSEELAFYDALTKPKAIKDFYKNNELINMTRDLTDSLRKNKIIDWQNKESARASMRKMIKRLLKKYKYPPDGLEDAISTVMLQCELWTDEIVII